MRRTTIVVAMLAATVASADASPNSERHAGGAVVHSRSHHHQGSTAAKPATSKQAVNARAGAQVPAAPLGAAAFTSARNANQTPQTAAAQATAQAAPAAKQQAGSARVAAHANGRTRVAAAKRPTRRLASRDRKAGVSSEARGSAPTAPETTGSIPAAPHGSIPAMVTAEARKAGVNPALAHAVVKVESRYSPNATGRGGYVGLMQLSYQTARGMGFRGSRKALYEPSNNLAYGMRYLAEAVRLSGGNTCAAVSKYQGGHGVHGVTKAGAVYCSKVKRFMAEGIPSGAQNVASN